MPILFVVAAVWLFFGYTKPLYTEISAKRATITENQSILDQAHALNSLKNSLLSTYKAYSEDDLGRIHKALPANVKPAYLMVSIGKLAENRGVIIKSVNFGSAFSDVEKTTSVSAPAPIPVAVQPSTSKGQSFIPPAVLQGVNDPATFSGQGTAVSPLTVEINVAAAYPAFVAFLQDLEANLEVTDVTSLSISGGDKQSEYKLSFSVYKMKESSVSAAPI